MRKTLLQTCRIDGQANSAVRRIATALDIPQSFMEVSSSALSAVAELELYIRDLQRENLELQFQVDNPGVDVDSLIAEEKAYIRDCLKNSVNSTDVFKRYDYDFFEDNYHPELVSEICSALCDYCRALNISPSPLWEQLKASTGFMTQEVINNFAPIEPDNGTI